MGHDGRWKLCPIEPGYVFLSIFCVAVGPLLRADDFNKNEVALRIQTSLQTFSEITRRDPSGREAAEYLNQARLPGDSILSYFYGVPGALQEVSPARQKRIEDVEGWLSPFENELANVIIATARSGDIPASASQIALFMRPTPPLRTALLRAAHDPEAHVDKAADAYATIFMLQLDDEEVRREVLDKVRWRDELDTRAELGSDLLRRAAMEWALPEIGPILVEMLSVPFTPANYPARGGRNRLLGQYLLAAEGLSRFGLTAADQVQLCRARLAELKSGDGTEDYTLRTLALCIERLEGKRIPEMAVNLKGKRLGANEEAFRLWETTNQTPAAKSLTETPSDKSKPTVVSTDGANESSDNIDHTATWWILGILVGLSTLVLLMRARRK